MVSGGEKMTEEENIENMMPSNPEMPQGKPPEEAPGGLKILSILYVILGIMWLIYPFFYMWFLAGYLQDLYGYIPWAEVFFNTTCCWIGSWLVGFIYFGIAGGLLRGFKGAWLWALIFAIVGLFNVPVGTIISIIIIVYLFTPNVKNWFK